jgi:hypothetical protein
METTPQIERPRVFISWSGTAAQIAANALVHFLERVIQTPKLFISTRGIPAGTPWPVELSKQLKKCDLGVICLTKDNLAAPWLLFEAGSLSKAFGKARVIPYLIGIPFSEVPDPLKHFNGVEANIEGTLKLVSSINKAVAARIGRDWRLSGHVLHDVVELHWNTLSSALDKVRNDAKAAIRLEKLQGVQERTRNLVEALKDFRAKHKNEEKRPPLRYSGFLSPFAIHSQKGRDKATDGESSMDAVTWDQLVEERAETIAIAKSGHCVKCMICPPCLSEKWSNLNRGTAEAALKRLENLRDFLRTDDYKTIENEVDWVVSPFPLSNTYILGDDVCFEGLRKDHGSSGYDLTIHYNDRDAVRTRRDCYDALWKHMQTAKSPDPKTKAGRMRSEDLLSLLNELIDRVKQGLKPTRNAGHESPRTQPKAVDADSKKQRLKEINTGSTKKSSKGVSAATKRKKLKGTNASSKKKKPNASNADAKKKAPKPRRNRVEKGGKLEKS